MINKYKTKRDEGFTIIEVLIVLAIAGLIILIVFLAVPALQRNSRNTQRKNDAQNLIGAINEYTTNNNGQPPTDSADGDGNTVVLSRGSGTNEQRVNLAFYAGTEVDFGTGGTAVTPVDHTGTLYIRTGAKCNTDGNDFTSDGATARSIAVVFAIETQGGAQGSCTES